MRSLIFATACAVGLLCGCGTKSPGPDLTVTPGGPLQITGPTAFTAELTNSDAEVTWTVTGGALSSESGLHVVYTPPLGTAAATLTARAGTLMVEVQISSSPAAITDKTIPRLTAPVTVQYDAQDVPHINCAAMVDCIAVQGYIQARDRLFPMDFLRHVSEGRLSEMIGLDGLSQDVRLRTIFTTRAGHRLQDDLAAAQDATTLALLTAFSTGVNAYLAELRSTANARLPAEYAQLPFPLTPADIEDWSPKDTLALGRLQQFQLSETLTEETTFGQFAAVYGGDAGKMTAWIRAAAPPSEHGHTLSERASFAAAAPARMPRPRGDLKKWKGVLDATAATLASLRDALRPADASVGSNNWVVAAAKSTTHMAMVANDPHLSLQYPPLFHLAAMTSSKASDNLDLTGGSFPGIPGALVGRGKHVGWGVTVVGYDVTDVYREQFAPQASCPGGTAGPPCVAFKTGFVSTRAADLPHPHRDGVRRRQHAAAREPAAGGGAGGAAPRPDHPGARRGGQGAQRPVDRARGQHAGHPGVPRPEHGDRRRCRDGGAQGLRDGCAELRARRRPGAHRVRPARAGPGAAVRRSRGGRRRRHPAVVPGARRRHGGVGRRRVRLRLGDAHAGAGVVLDRRRRAAARQGSGEGVLLHRQRRSDLAVGVGR
jgi:hypothetical protein